MAAGMVIAQRTNVDGAKAVVCEAVDAERDVARGMIPAKALEGALPSSSLSSRDVRSRSTSSWLAGLVAFRAFRSF